jgi:hypothetical protein
MKLDEIRFSFEIAWDDPWYKWQSIATVLLCIAASAFVLWKIIPVGIESGLIVFHYNQYFGIDEVQPWWWVFVYIGTVLAIVFVDLIASFQTYRHDKIISRILLCLATIFAILISVGAR